MATVSESEKLPISDVPGIVQRPRRDYWLRRLLVLADLTAVLAGLVLMAALPASGDFTWEQLWFGLATVPLWIVLFKLYGLYDRDAKRISHYTVDDAPPLFHALAVGTLGACLLSRPLPITDLSIQEGVAFFLAVFVTAFPIRALARRTARVAIRRERVLFVGDGPTTWLLMNKMQQHEEYGLEPIGYLAPQHPGDGPSSGSGLLPCLGDVTDLDTVCDRHGIERVVLVSPSIGHGNLGDVIRQVLELNIRMSLVPQVTDVLGPAVELDDLEGITVLGINPPVLTRSSRFLKRTMDLVVAAITLVVFLPLMAIIAITVKVTSPGPVLYFQLRVGRAGSRFRIWKFRTMVRDAEQQAEALQALSMHHAWILLEEDPRVTSVGRVLRRWSLDELPQLWNVLRGDMSLVGPRPMTPEIDERISGWGRRRLDLTPGITGLWQVLGRTDIAFEEMLTLDYIYVMNWSLWRDVRLLVQTLPAVLQRRGAN